MAAFDDKASEHLLDNPAWYAVCSAPPEMVRSPVPTIRYFEPDISPFAGLPTYDEESLLSMYAALAAGSVLITTPKPLTIPPPWIVAREIEGVQMIYASSSPPRQCPGVRVTPTLTLLTNSHVPDMMSLVAVTHPGPFSARTFELGHYYGIFCDGKLASMAGQRLHMPGYAEISAVCTHPDYTGRGYAKCLLSFHIRRILEAGEIPFLHVRSSNEGAIAVYKKSGFVVRRDAYFYVCKKEDETCVQQRAETTT